jgi:hypothetical protein
MATALLGLAAGWPAGIAAGQSLEAFQIGGSCAGLAYLNKDQITTVLAAAFADDMHSFCYPEEPSECSDYSGFLQGAGRLSTGDDDFHCSLSQ